MSVFIAKRNFLCIVDVKRYLGRAELQSSLQV